LKASLSNHIKRDLGSAREHLIDIAADAADTSIADESKSEDFAEADLDATILQQVQDALGRIERRMYGRRLIDRTPIDPKPRCGAICRVLHQAPEAT
jgi:hypothetical protein